MTDKDIIDKSADENFTASAKLTGLDVDIRTGLIREWYRCAGDVKRWSDNDEPCE